MVLLKETGAVLLIGALLGLAVGIVRGFPEVQECYLITGQEADYQLKVVVPNMDEYQRFLLEKITRIEGVIGVHSSFVLRKSVESTALPLSYIRKRGPSSYSAQAR